MEMKFLIIFHLTNTKKKPYFIESAIIKEN